MAYRCLESLQTSGFVAILEYELKTTMRICVFYYHIEKSMPEENKDLEQELEKELEAIEEENASEQVEKEEQQEVAASEDMKEAPTADDAVDPFARLGKKKVPKAAKPQSLQDAMKNRKVKKGKKISPRVFLI